MTATSWGFRASTGLDFTAGEIVDAHFAACAAAFRGMVRSVGIRPGWTVLDAGCGTGAWLPLLGELVGPGGSVLGVDLAPENVAQSRTRGVEVRQGDLRALPVPDGSVDAVWCANTTQYLDDAGLAAALAEFRRVLRPGGLLAVKEIDATLITVRPGDPYLFPSFFAAAARTSPYAAQLSRTRELRRHVAAAGFDAVRQRTELLEHFAPFSPAELAFYGASCAQLARQAGDAPGWAALRDPDDPANPLRHPDGYVSQGVALVTGSRPA